MKTFATLLIDPEGRKDPWIMSLHTDRPSAEARLRAYVNGVISGGPKALAPWLPPGHDGSIPQIQTGEVENTAKALAYYDGEIRVRRSHNLRRKAG